MWLTYVAQAIDQTRWTLEGEGREVADRALRDVARKARQGSELLASELRVIGEPPDARPNTISTTRSVPYLRGGWIAVPAAVSGAREYLSAVRSWILLDHDDLVERGCRPDVIAALDHGIRDLDSAVKLLMAIETHD